MREVVCGLFLVFSDRKRFVPREGTLIFRIDCAFVTPRGLYFKRGGPIAKFGCRSKMLIVCARVLEVATFDDGDS